MGAQLTVTCPKCNRDLSNEFNAAFCSYCGHKLGPSFWQQYTRNNSVSTERKDEMQPSSDNAPTEPITAESPLQNNHQNNATSKQNGASQPEPASSTSTLTPLKDLDEIMKDLGELIIQSDQVPMEQYFPGNLPDKAKKIEEWKAQLQRAYGSAELSVQPQFIRYIDEKQDREIRSALAEAARILDFTREYTVKLIGHTGVGKSTLMAAMIGQDIFPRIAGGAVTAVPTHVRLCEDPALEEMSIHFFSREEFDRLVKLTQDSLKKVEEELAKKEISDEKEISDKELLRRALEAELSLLQRTDQAHGAQYLKDIPYRELVPQTDWETKISDFVEEPNTTDQEVRPTRLVKFVEFTLHTTNPSPTLPAKSILVDLPGGSAGLPRHDMILQEELKTTDAVLLVVDSARGGDNKETQHIFQTVKNKFVKDKGDKDAAQMIFVVVTHWERIQSDKARTKIRGSMHKLLEQLPKHYELGPKHGKENAFFYQLRTLDALVASLSLSNKNVATTHSEDVKEYISDMDRVYSNLRKINPSLGLFTAKKLEDVSEDQHEAMLDYSGFKELANDLQTFLSTNRYDTQLADARKKIDSALRQLDDICHKQLRDLNFRGYRLQDLRAEMRKRQNKHEQELLNLLHKRINAMFEAWEKATQQFDKRVHSDFPTSLNMAYINAKEQVEERIKGSEFDIFFETNDGASKPTRLEQNWIDVQGQKLIDALRTTFMLSMEQEIDTLAPNLAEAFLGPIGDKENEGILNIQRVALDEIWPELSSVEKNYEDMKADIEKKAHAICRYVIMGELLDKTRYELASQSNEVNAVYLYARTSPGSKDQIHNDINAILSKLCDGLPASVEDRIMRLFHYEIDKLQAGAPQKNREEHLSVADPGEFTNIVEALRTLLRDRFREENSPIRRKLEEQEEHPDVESWFHLIGQIERLKSSTYKRSISQALVAV